MALIQPDVDQTLASFSWLELAAGVAHCCSAAAQASSLIAVVIRRHLDVDSFETCILVRDLAPS